MTQALDQNDWRSIRFETTDLPQSLMGISILISIDRFSERTGDWIWHLPHCNGVEKQGEASWCIESATEIVDCLLEHRSEILRMIEDHLGPHGFSPVETFAEWMTSLVKIREIAAKKDDDCPWIAEMPGFDPKPEIEQAMRFFDSLDPPP